jgi:Fe-S-cluster containining protein
MTKSELCVKCQECCKELTFEVPLYHSTLEFYKARGLKTIYKDKHTVLVLVPHICNQLTGIGCTIYARRPHACKVFDGRKSLATKDICLWNKEDCDD